MKTKTEKYPDYLQASPEGVIYVDVDEWKKSPQRKREIEHTEQLVEYLKSKNNNNAN
jgi:hypothetical protein